MPEFVLRPPSNADRDNVRKFIAQRWGAETVVAHGIVYHPHKLPGFLALRDEEMVGLVTCHIEGDACEIVTIDSMQPGDGIGTVLIDAVQAFARQSDCKRVWLITTNLVQSHHS